MDVLSKNPLSTIHRLYVLFSDVMEHHDTSPLLDKQELLRRVGSRRYTASSSPQARKSPVSGLNYITRDGVKFPHDANLDLSSIMDVEIIRNGNVVPLPFETLTRKEFPEHYKLIEDIIRCEVAIKCQDSPSIEIELDRHWRTLLGIHGLTMSRRDLEVHSRLSRLIERTFPVLALKNPENLYRKMTFELTSNMYVIKGTTWKDYAMELGRKSKESQPSDQSEEIERLERKIIALENEVTKLEEEKEHIRQTLLLF